MGEGNRLWELEKERDHAEEAEGVGEGEGPRRKGKWKKESESVKGTREWGESGVAHGNDVGDGQGTGIINNKLIN